MKHGFTGFDRRLVHNECHWSATFTAFGDLDGRGRESRRRNKERDRGGCDVTGNRNHDLPPVGTEGLKFESDNNLNGQNSHQKTHKSI
jgi:hypothetical protein